MTGRKRVLKTPAAAGAASASATEASADAAQDTSAKRQRGRAAPAVPAVPSHLPGSASTASTRMASEPVLRLYGQPAPAAMSATAGTMAAATATSGTCFAARAQHGPGSWASRMPIGTGSSGSTLSSGSSTTTASRVRNPFAIKTDSNAASVSTTAGSGPLSGLGCIPDGSGLGSNSNAGSGSSNSNVGTSWTARRAKDPFAILSETLSNHPSSTTATPALAAASDAASSAAESASSNRDAASPAATSAGPSDLRGFANPFKMLDRAPPQSLPHLPQEQPLEQRADIDHGRTAKTTTGIAALLSPNPARNESAGSSPSQAQQSPRSFARSISCPAPRNANTSGTDLAGSALEEDDQGQNDHDDADHNDDAERFYALLARKNDGSSLKLDVSSLMAWQPSVPSASLQGKDRPRLIKDLGQKPLPAGSPTTNRAVSARPVRQVRVPDSDPLVDWTLKTEMIILSEQTLDWCTFASSIAEAQCLSNFTRSIDSPQDPCERFMRNTFTWVFPARPPPPSSQHLVTRILTKVVNQKTPLDDFERLEYKNFQEREEEWKHSFQSLYFALKSCETPYFYYINSHFTVLFTAAKSLCIADAALSSGGSSTPQLKAYVTRASAGMRSELQREDIEWTEGHGFEADRNDERRRVKSTLDRSRIIVFDDENANQDDDYDAKDGDERDNLDEPEDQTKTPHTKDGPNLMISQSGSVHAFFDYLLNWTDPQTDMRAANQPLLISPRPFLNSSLKRMQVVSRGKVAEPVTDPVTGDTRVQSLHKLHLSGLVLPTHLHRMVSCLVDQQRSTYPKHKSDARSASHARDTDAGQDSTSDRPQDFSVLLTTDDKTSGFPLAPLARSSDADMHGSAGMPRVLRSIQAQDGWLTIK
ncbi:hypothetical protein BC831DRAFT_474335 [Entophlyctis helioformis]|nr:hypothetical protein BC831DRAFT_474335 [Entophlyctis helioformis]